MAQPVRLLHSALVACALIAIFPAAIAAEGAGTVDAAEVPPSPSSVEEISPASDAPASEAPIHDAPASDVQALRALIGANKNLSGDLGAIRAAATRLSGNQRSMIFNEFRKGSGNAASIGIGANILLGFGIGSFIIGDEDGGRMMLAFDCASIALAFGALYGNSVMQPSHISNPATSSLGESAFTLTMGLGIMAAVLKCVSFISAFANPLEYISTYDSRLKAALAPGAALGFAPCADFVALAGDGTGRGAPVLAVQVGFRLAY